MRIGIDGRFYGGEFAKGLGRYTEKLVEYLVAHDREHTYVLFLQDEGIAAWRKRFGHLKLEEQGRWTLVRAPYRWYTLAEQLKLPRLLKKAHVDTMLFPHFNVPFLYRRPFIVTIHDLIILKFPTERATTLGPLLYKLKHMAGKMVMRHAALSSSHVITVSEFSKKDICEYYGLPESRVSVTYEAAHAYPSTQTRTPEQEREMVMQSFGVSKPFVLYVGNAYPHKNVEVLLDVAQKAKQNGAAPTWQILLVGKKDYFYERLQQSVQERGLQDVVVFAGFVTDEQLGALYRTAAAYIFPSLYEGFGLPPLEAMQYGTPVISSNASCMPEILGDAALMVDPHAVSDILRAVERVWHEPALRADLSARGRAQVARYSWERMMQQTREIIEQYGK